MSARDGMTESHEYDCKGGDLCACCQCPACRDNREAARVAKEDVVAQRHAAEVAHGGHGT